MTLRTVLMFGLVIWASHGAQAQESEFAVACKAALRKACKAESWANLQVDRPTAVMGGQFKTVNPNPQVIESVKQACEGSPDMPDYLRAQYAGADALRWEMYWPAIVEAAKKGADVETKCALAEQQVVVLQKQIAVAQGTQDLLKGDLQVILGKLLPGAKVEITLPAPPAPAASSPKADKEKK